MSTIFPSAKKRPTKAEAVYTASGHRVHPVLFIALLGALTALGPFTMDLYLPAFPDLAGDLGASATAVQATLTATAIGLGVGQLLVGPISDALGRRVPLLTATTLHVAASIGVALAPTIELVAAARFGQGFGAAAGAVVASAMVRDLFGGIRFIRVAARIALVTGLAPIAAPVIGSQLLVITDWRGVFWLLAAFGALVVIGAFAFIPETRVPVEAGQVKDSFVDRARVLLRDRVYLGVVLISAMVFAAIVSYLSASPFIFQTGYLFSEQEFGLLFAVNAIGLLGATQLAAALMRRFEPAHLLAVALPLLVTSGVALVVVGLMNAGWIWAAIASALLVALHGFTNPCTSVLVLAHHQARSGTAVALSGFVNSIVGGVLSLIPAVLGGVNATSLGIVVAVAAFAALAALWIVVRPATVPPIPRH